MTYELAKQLKGAGFPQKENNAVYYEMRTDDINKHLPYRPNVKVAIAYYFPTLIELIEACPSEIVPIGGAKLHLNAVFTLTGNKDKNDWLAGYSTPFDWEIKPLGEGKAPEEAVARLWLALNKKRNPRSGRSIMKKNDKKIRFPHVEMLEEIDALVNNDWAFDIECHFLPGKRPFTQKEAREMAEVIGKVYSIAHCIHCKACGVKYGIGK